jgi:hypothetical protein
LILLFFIFVMQSYILFYHFFYLSLSCILVYP